jgi:hypothetical protein
MANATPLQTEAADVPAVTVAGSSFEIPELESNTEACFEKELSRELKLGSLGMEFVLVVRRAKKGESCSWSDGFNLTAPSHRSAVAITVASVSPLYLDGVAPVYLYGTAIADGTNGFFGVPCIRLTLSTQQLQLAGFQVEGLVLFTVSGSQCPWDATPSPLSTLRLRLTSALSVGPAAVSLRGEATIVKTGSQLRVPCLELIGSLQLDGLDLQANARYTQANNSCSWADGSASVAEANSPLGELRLTRGVLRAGSALVALSGSAVVEKMGGGNQSVSLVCAELTAGGSGAPTLLAGVDFMLAARYAKGGRRCAQLADSPFPADTLIYVLENGSVHLGSAQIRLSGKAVVVDAMLSCAELNASSSVVLGTSGNGLAVTASGQYAARHADCGWNNAAAAAEEQLKLRVSEARVSFGPSVLVFGGEVMLTGGSVMCLQLGASAGVASLFGGAAVNLHVNYAAANASCSFAASLAAEETLAVAASGMIRIADANVDFTGSALVLNGSVSCLSFEAGSNSGVLGLGGLSARVSAQWIAANASCPPLAALTTSQLLVQATSQILIGSSAIQISGTAAVVGGRVARLTFQLRAALVLGQVSIQVDSVSVVYQSGKPVELTVAQTAIVIDGLGGLLVNGSAELVSGRLSALQLQVQGLLVLGPVTVTGGGALAYSAANDSLSLQVADGRISVIGLGAVVVNGQAVLVNGGLRSLDLAVQGALTVASVRLQGNTAFQVRRNASGATTVRLMVTNATVDIASFGSLAVSGELAIANGRLANFEVNGALNLALAGVRITGTAALRYNAAGNVFTLAVSGSLQTGILGAVLVSGSAQLINGRLTQLSLNAQGAIQLGGISVTGAIVFNYAAASQSLSLGITNGQIIVGSDLQVWAPEDGERERRKMCVS